METVVMVIGEKMFSGAQESGREGEGTVKMNGESSNSRMDKGAGFGQTVRFASRERILPTTLQIRFCILNSNL